MDALMGYLRLAWRVPRLLAWTVVGLLLATLVSLSQGLRQPLSLAQRQGLTQFWLRGLCACLPLRIQRHGLPSHVPALWLSNHVSWLDIAVLGSCTPLTFLSKAEVRHWPIIGWLAEQAGTLFIQRGSGDAQALTQVIGERLSLGQSVLVFPEGTTTDGRSVRTFHSRLLSCRDGNNSPIQLAAVRYRRDGARDDLAPFIGDDALHTHLWRLLQAPCTEVQLQLLALERPADEESRRELGKRLQARVQHAVEHGPARDNIVCYAGATAAVTADSHAGFVPANGGSNG
ncbi:lysophospholipid acyltransferase family protein [Atopomonas sediminilitoris]|uniref:lysophospholipid acyltransferase family protein n=1 Tax=Atopomonas sediminilitoris TaxID=2919919 RepID=UPI001F4F0B90|nr:lysophospholipid acyltransferase family protein [Atopomonas sediminilitoris]MCJ8168699.1 1-acyl-sn-glycerol-3-phosphate acyltransferase [Atopomonas sediminilitoris]